ncbi:MAG TPA: hypothetical protein ENL08_05670 [Bacteroidetes bacterium]|nr:hypothetical protein [Bacteroidota bacterium]
MMQVPHKIGFDEFICTCTPLLRIPELEEEMRQRVQRLVDGLLDFEPSGNRTDDLVEFLRRDKDFLGVLLALTNLSQEKLLRVITAKRFADNDFKPEWGIKRVYRKICEEKEFAVEIAKMFLEGRKNPILAEQVADFYLDQLKLPESWFDIIQDDKLIGNVIRKKLTGEYSDQKGKHIEGMICARLDSMGFSYRKGQVPLLGKEVDIAILSLEDPYVLIMVSYMETTSSGQTTRANEQNKIFQDVIARNVRYNENRALVNIVDGAGWLARRSDLRKLHNGCHYCLNFKNLDLLEGIIRYHIP